MPCFSVLQIRADIRTFKYADSATTSVRKTLPAMRDGPGF